MEFIENDLFGILPFIIVIVFLLWTISHVGIVLSGNFIKMRANIIILIVIIGGSFLYKFLKNDNKNIEIQKITIDKNVSK